MYPFRIWNNRARARCSWYFKTRHCHWFFARMEKFSDEFANVLLAVLERTKNTKILIAGPNDSSLVVRSFSKYFKDQRALVLGESDTQILGNCVDIGLDTFPTHSGFSMLELMAKGVPVVSKNDEGIDGYWRHRLPGLLCSNDEEVIDRLCELSDDEKLRIEFSFKHLNSLMRRNTTLPLLMLFMKH